MQVESVHGAHGVLSIRCSGTVGIGFASTASLRPLGAVISGWMRVQEEEAVREIVVDFTNVDYRWGDAPVACFLPFVRRGVERVRFRAGPRSAKALRSLLAVSNLPWFALEQAEA
ncbi:MAG TPA: hypothetical protein VFY93_18345 [Planctomycetota bacterium]|nr:hypothetical protein [Planctomycetota bacterium]